MVKSLFYLLALSVALVSGTVPAGEDANPSVPMYGYGSIVASPNPPVVGSPTTIRVTVSNSGTEAAHGVQVKLSFNTWGVVFDGWQEIETQTADIPAGGEETLTFTHVFISRTHTCLEAKIVDWGEGGNSVTTDDRGQINLEVVHSGENDFSYQVPVANNGNEPIKVELETGCMIDGKFSRVCPDGVVVEAKAPKELELAAGEEVLVEVSAIGLSATDAMDVVLQASTNDKPEEPWNHVVLQVVPASVADLLDSITLCCLERVKFRVFLGTILLRALQAYEDDAWSEALRLLRIFAQKASAIQCYLTEEESACLEKAVAIIVDISRMLASRIQADAVAMAEDLRPAPEPGNIASVEAGGVAFGSSSLSVNQVECTSGAAGTGIHDPPATGYHCWENINDGEFGNAHSWIPNAGSDKGKQFVGVRFAGPATISEIEVSRDRLGQYTDRSGFVQEVEVTKAADPSHLTPDSEWEKVLTMQRTDPLKAVFAFGAPLRGVTGIRLVQTCDNYNSCGCTDELVVAGTLDSTAPVQQIDTASALLRADSMRLAGQYEAAVLDYQASHYSSCGICAAHIATPGHDDKFADACASCRFLFTSVQYPYQLGVRRQRQQLSATGVTSVQYPYQLTYFTSVQGPYQLRADQEDAAPRSSVQWPYRLESLTSVQAPYQLAPKDERCCKNDKATTTVTETYTTCLCTHL